MFDNYKMVINNEDESTADSNDDSNDDDSDDDK